MSPSAGEQFVFHLLFFLYSPLGDWGCPFYFYRVKFRWWENWVMQQQPPLSIHFASLALLYIGSIVHRPVRFSLFYCAMAFLLFYPGMGTTTTVTIGLFFECRRGDTGGAWLRRLSERDRRALVACLISISNQPWGSRNPLRRRRYHNYRPQRVTISRYYLATLARCVLSARRWFTPLVGLSGPLLCRNGASSASRMDKQGEVTSVLSPFVEPLVYLPCSSGTVRWVVTSRRG